MSGACAAARLSRRGGRCARHVKKGQKGRVIQVAMMTSGMYASSTCEWETPQALFDWLDAAYHFECDVCATAENAKCAKYYDRETDGLKQTWTGVCWMNPPYGREIGKWMHKALDSARAGAVVVCLVPARTDTAWWHDTVMQGGQIHFLRGRLKFGG